MDKRFGPCRALSPLRRCRREGANLLIFTDFVNRYLHLNCAIVEGDGDTGLPALQSKMRLKQNRVRDRFLCLRIQVSLWPSSGAYAPDALIGIVHNATTAAFNN
jgi:hypothetical protein